ncbi:DUF4249 domain-containing protein [Microscilla marina]|nr:DUF4249 domain-containing protein [Microscilla marina]
MKSRIYLYIMCMVAVATMTACEDEINVTLGESTPQLTVEGWVSDQTPLQTIRLTISQDYFDNAAAAGASGATVRVNDDQGNVYNFVESDLNSGDYLSNFTGAIGRTYTLYIQYQGEEYQATTQLARVPPIDSIRVENADDASPGPVNVSSGYRAEFFANEIPGAGDYYRIKTYRNDVLLNKPGNISVFEDTNVDGLPFILPVRLSINPISEDGEGYALGDKIKVELLSISKEAFLFFEELETQTTNGGLFANPIANVPTNIQNINPASAKKAVGFFYASAVSSLEVTVTE